MNCARCSGFYWGSRCCASETRGVRFVWRVARVDDPRARPSFLEAIQCFDVLCGESITCSGKCLAKLPAHGGGYGAVCSFTAALDPVCHFPGGRRAYTTHRVNRCRMEALESAVAAATTTSRGGSQAVARQNKFRCIWSRIGRFRGADDHTGLNERLELASKICLFAPKYHCNRCEARMNYCSMCYM